MLRNPEPNDTKTLLAIAEATGIFLPGEVEGLLGSVLSAYHARELGDGHHIVLWAEVDSNRPMGWAYLAASEKAPGVWDLWWIGVEPSSQGKHVGARLLDAVEETVRSNKGRVLIIETNTTPALARTREFYRRRGYTECGTVPDFYGPGEGKVPFAKTL